ncbi:MAG: TonB-dependent receptor [Bdellovibrionaceae bacterium]|nr:TonB-dependent receptor [Pseudobdellovibrionaceae bacterium]
MKSFIQLAALTLVPAYLIAQTTTTTPNQDSSTRYETKVFDTSFSTSSKVVIDKEEIQDSKAANMSALLSTKANISITNTAFQPNSVLVRGGDASQILILIDDVPVYDASTVQRSFNLNSVSLNSVQRITVIKGSQSVWYGGQALSAVIKIDTLPRVWSENSRVDIQGGADDYREISTDLFGRISDSSLTILRGQYQFQNSSSPIENSEFRYKKRKDNVEAAYLYRDDYQYNFKLSRSTDRNENITGVSAMDFAAADTLDFVFASETNQFQFAFNNNSVSYKPFVSVGFVESHRVFSHNVNFYNSVEENQEYKSYLIPIRGELRLLNRQNWKWDVGASWQKEVMLYEMFKEKQAQTGNEMSGVFTKVEWLPSAAVSVLAGYRYETDLLFRDVNTYQVGMTYQNIRIEHSTGHRLPSLYQLYSNKGNTSLSPESARTYTLSHDKVIDEQWETSVTLFETHIENLIAARGTPLQYYNVGRTITKGVEGALFYRYSPEDKWTFNVAYQEPRDVNTGRWLVRRPLQSASIVYSQKRDQATWNVELVGRGSRDDTRNPFQTVRLNGYGTVSTSYIYKLSDYGAKGWAMKEASLYFRGQNLTSEKYDESYGYRSPGMEFFAGVRAGF